MLLRNIREGKAPDHGVTIDEVLEYDYDTSVELDAFFARRRIEWVGLLREVSQLEAE